VGDRAAQGSYKEAAMKSETVGRRRQVIPPAPRTLEEAGLSFDAVMQLVVKLLHLAGELSGAELAERLGLRYSVLEPVLHHLRTTYLCEVSGGGLIGGPSYEFRVTDAGRARAMLFLENNRYVGVAPVPFRHYEKYMRTFDEQVSGSVTRAQVQQALSHLVLSDRVIDQLGPAVNGGHSLFVYGPPGNGKTVIAQGVKNLLEGDIAIPHAIEQDGHLVQVYDPVIHETRPHLVSDDLDTGDPPDGRWLRCRRPLVTVGGELQLTSLELAHDQTSGFYRAPIQLAANGGVLVIDDFGRQRCSVVELLNRWITPLESRTDYLTLTSGQKLPVPFVVLVVLATNIKPADLVDEAFLRRIQTKIHVGVITPEQFHAIFKRVCADNEMPYDPGAIDTVIELITRQFNQPLRPCHPRDLVNQIRWGAKFNGTRVELNKSSLAQACANYLIET
jgi:hypothetical protein